MPSNEEQRFRIDPPTIDQLFERFLERSEYRNAQQLPRDFVLKMVREIFKFEHNWNANVVKMFDDHLKYCASVPPVSVDALRFK